MFLKIFFLMFGLGIVVSSFYYKKNTHKQFTKNISGQPSSIIEAIIFVIIGFLLSISPWWIIKIFLFLIGSFIIYMSLFLI